MQFKDYYKILGIEKSATQDEVKRSYRKLARKLHPDINKDPKAESQFKELSEAYEVLGDVDKRVAYNQLGQERTAGEEFRPPPNWDEGFEYSGARRQAAEPEFSDFFEQLFGDARRHGRPSQGRADFHARGEDHHAKIVVDLKDTFAGATRALSLRVPHLDESGHVSVRDRTLNVQIPKGVTEGQSIRLKGQGAPGVGRLPSGDLYLEIQFKPDPLYRPVGRDLYLELPVAPWEAALGGSVKVPTPMGPIILKIPAGSFHGREMRIKGRGIPASEPGDLYAVLKIALPPADSAEAKAVYENMARELPFNPRAHLGV